MSKALVWHGQRNPLPSAAKLTAQPRWGHSDENAITGASLPAGWRISQTDPTGSLGYLTQASRRSWMMANERGTPTSSSFKVVSVWNDSSRPRFRSGERRYAIPGTDRTAPIIVPRAIVA